MWNLAVDPRGGPRDEASSQGCADDRGLLASTVTRSAPGPEFYVLAHLQRAVGPVERGCWAVRVGRGVAGGRVRQPRRHARSVFTQNDTRRTDQVVGVRLPGRGRTSGYAVREDELLSLRVTRTPS